MWIKNKQSKNLLNQKQNHSLSETFKNIWTIMGSKIITLKENSLKKLDYSHNVEKENGQKEILKILEKNKKEYYKQCEKKLILIKEISYKKAMKNTTKLKIIKEML